MRIMALFVATCICVTGSIGCTSIKSTHVKRDENICGWKTDKLHGYPITVKVSHQLEVRIMKKEYVQGNKVLRDAVTGKPIQTRYAKFKVLERDEIFTVDFKRPGAGTLTYNVELDAEKQYFEKIHNEIEDKTIEAITQALGIVGEGFSAIPRAKPAGNFGDLNVGTIESLVGITVIDITDPELEQKVHAFLCRYLTGCTPPCSIDGNHPAMGHPTAPPFVPNLREEPVPLSEPRKENTRIQGSRNIQQVGHYLP